MTAPARVVGLGAGGHAKVVLDIIGAMGGVEVVGVLDADPQRHGSQVLGATVLGGDGLLGELGRQGVTHFFVGIGSVGDAGVRRRVWKQALEHGFEPLAAVHPAAVVAASVRLGLGATVMAGAVINPGVVLGDNVIVNTGAVVDHDCRLGDHVHVAPGACLSGNVEVGEGAHVGVGASIRQGIRIGDGAVVGAGAVVVKDVPAGLTVVGVPAAPSGRQS